MSVRHGFRLYVAALIAVILSGAPLAASVSDRVGGEAVNAVLVTAEDGVAPDATTLSAGLDVTLGDGWKTYWRSPGEVGLPPAISWDGSTNVASVDVLWPAPTRFRAFGIENFGYAERVTFPLQITLETPGAPAALRASVDLLICSDLCVPQTLDLALDMPEGAGIDGEAADLIAAAVARVPDAEAAGLTPGSAHLDSEEATLTVTARSERAFRNPDAFPELDGAAFGAPDIRLGESGRLLWARFPVLSAASGTTDLRVTITDGDRAGTVRPPRIDEAIPPPFALDRVVLGSNDLFRIALIAFLGGLILNVMPCVLPVLSIKIATALKIHDGAPRRARIGFLVSALGVMAFMAVLAAGTILARAAGLSVGWGLQFQNPVFLAAMIGLLTLFSANLLGLFEITLPASWMTALARRETRPGYGGDFATGAFTAILATPCSAPFLGTAIAFALAGRGIDIVMVFAALGLGLALPYLGLAMRPSLLRALPKPGPWTMVVKVALGLSLLFTVAWLIWVLSGVAGHPTAGLVTAFAAMTVLCLWQSHRLTRSVAIAGLGIAGAGMLTVPALTISEPVPAARTETLWRDFDRSRIPRLVSEGQVVFVDVTADWCLTCKANKALVLDRGEVAEALTAPDVVPMQADWTRSNPAISRYLAAHGRFGIPFNVVYGPGAAEGLLLPEILTTETVLEALSTAASRVQVDR
ncbi:protein-disulfide reductase DsbD family protein [Palleronia aestuarii]|uniref:protein-disulfide reductase DsbD family protein n=1 Tax=Palleronia aestuarii TaxID=568105 RepID=UPI001F33F0CD|nr:protein-disulfide reductase DsbD domain-containing protein [Palleronia aestuarii]